MTSPPPHPERRAQSGTDALERGRATFPNGAIRLCALLFLCLSCAKVLAGQASGYDFLLDEPAAPAAALSGAVSAAAGQLYALRYNPAGLAGIGDLDATLSSVSAVGDWNEDWAALAAKWGPAVVGGEALISNITPFTLYDQNGNPVGTATSGNQNVGLGAALGWTDWLRFGADVRYFRSQIYTYSSQGVAADLGVQAGRTDGPLTAGLAVQNLGEASAYISQTNPLPLLLRVGLRGNLDLEPGLKLALESDVVDYQDSSRPTEVRLGAETAVRGRLFLRAGWTQSAGFSGPSLGIGIKWNVFDLDYAYGSSGILGANQLVELSVTEP